MDARRFVQELIMESRARFIPVMREKTAALLAEIIAERKPERVLEIGTCLGVSGITALISGAKRLTTIEKDPDRLEEAKKNFALCGVADRAELIEGDCFDILPYMENNAYDMIIIDGPKSKYCEIYDMLLPTLGAGGIIFCDDVEFYGRVKDENLEHKHRTIVKGMMNFYEKITSDARVDTKLYSFENGVAVIEVKGDNK